MSKLRLLSSDFFYSMTSNKRADSVCSTLDHTFQRYDKLPEDSWYTQEDRARSAFPFHLPTSDPEAHGALNAVQQCVDALETLWRVAKKEEEIMLLAVKVAELRSKEVKTEYIPREKV